MNLFKSFIFNRNVLGLLIGACIVVSAMDLYLDYARVKILNAVALLTAKNMITMIGDINEMYKKQGANIQPMPSASLIDSLNSKMKLSGSGLSLRLINEDSKKDQFQKKAFEVLKENKDKFYEIELINDQTILRYAIKNTMFAQANEQYQGIIELDIALSSFETIASNEAIKIFFIMIFMAFFTTIILIFFTAHLRESSETLEEKNKSLALINKKLEAEQEQVRNLNIGLEQRVIERTKQLQRSKDALQETLGRLKQADDFLNNVINSMPSALIIIDSDFKIIQCNDQASLVTKVEQSRIIGRSIFDILLFLRNHIKVFYDALKDKKIHKIDNISYMVHDIKHYFDIVIYPLSEQDYYRLVVRIDDVTERVLMGIKLVQNDKMASLGILTAGVAHEINNPINFITATINPLSKNITEIISVVEKYNHLQISDDIKSELNSIDVYKRQIDLPYLLAETHKLLEAIKDGAQRTAAIVRELRAFTRSDEDVKSMKKANIETCIDSAITILKPKIKNRIEIIKQYGNVPEIDCYPGKINQLVLNILANAIDSIEKLGKIFITTSVNENNVVVKIRDTGVGIKWELRSKIFEPFFTTKAVDAGTGLGLSISYEIVKEHHGIIEFTSEVGTGTEFIITLPIKQSDDIEST